MVSSKQVVSRPVSLLNDSMEKAKGKLKTAGFGILGALRQILLGALIGALCGLLGAAFDKLVLFSLGLREAHWWILFLAPAGGLAVVGLYTLLRVRAQDTNTVIEAVASNSRVSIGLFPAIFLGTAITHLVGGSAGREGAALQMGGSVGSGVASVFRLNGPSARTAVLCGMAAFFSAIFGVPVTAAVFVITIAGVGAVFLDALLPCLISSFAAFWVAEALGVEAVRFSVIAPDAELIVMLKYAALAIGATVAAVIFYNAIHLAHRLFEKLFKNRWVRIVAGACLIIAITLLCRSWRYNGTGMSVITSAIENGEVFWQDWILKIILTAVTLGTGFKGGEIVPSFFVGATFGCWAGPLLGLDASFAAAFGLICVFCASTNSPLAAIVLAVEMFGAGGFLYFAAGCALCFAFSGRGGLYGAQRFTDPSRLLGKDDDSNG